MKNKNIQLSQPLADLLTDYLISRKSENLRETTRDNYNFMIMAFMQFMLNNGVERIEDVTPTFIRKYKLSLQESGKKASTIDAHHRCLATFFKWLNDNDYLSHNPMLKVKKTKFDLEQKPIFTGQDIRRMYSACQNELEKAVVYLFLDCGLRVSEAINIKIEDVDKQRGFILLRNTKGRIDRSVSIGTKTSIILRRMLLARRKQTSEVDYLFVNRSGNRFTRSGLTQVFMRIKKRAGITTEGRLHGMRRTCLTTLVKNGCDLPTIQKLSGHKDIKTLADHYLVIDEQTMRMVVKEKGAVAEFLP